jgi:RimJ/RimL family protein N-acetyltransferase
MGMKFQIAKLSQVQAKEVCDDWIYEGDYAIYNVSWADAVAQRWSIADENKRAVQFRGVFDERNALIGFFRMTEDDQDEVEIGMGMRPDLCGKGWGKAFVDAATAYTQKRFPQKRLYLEVRIFNQRAIRCYQSAGYAVKVQHEKMTPAGITAYLRMDYER